MYVAARLALLLVVGSYFVNSTARNLRLRFEKSVFLHISYKYYSNELNAWIKHEIIHRAFYEAKVYNYGDSRLSYVDIIVPL